MIFKDFKQGEIQIGFIQQLINPPSFIIRGSGLQ